MIRGPRRKSHWCVLIPTQIGWGGQTGMARNAVRSTVTIPALVTYESHPDQHSESQCCLTVNLYERPSIKARNVQIPV